MTTAPDRSDSNVVASPSRSRRIADAMKANRLRASVVAFLVFLFVGAMAGLESDAWVSTIFQGLSVGAIVFLVASGFQLIFGLMDVLNLAHGELFMIGAFIGWTVYTRFDTFLDVLIPLLVIASALALWPLWRRIGNRLGANDGAPRVIAWALVAVGAVTVFPSITNFPLTIWDTENFMLTPANMSVQMDLGTLAPLPADSYGWPMPIAFSVLFLGVGAVAAGIAALRPAAGPVRSISFRNALAMGGVIAAAALLEVVKPSMNEWVFGISTTWRFFMAVIVATLAGATIGAVVEIFLIRPLYDRPIYTLIVTLGVGFVLIELARQIWGRAESTMTRPAAFNGTGPGCPAEGFAGFFSGCSTLTLFGSRLRVYNEGFIVLVGLAVLIAVNLLLKRTRIGMTIRAGVQDREMTEALGINVRRVFTQVFALGAGLAALGGVLAAPSIGLSPGMGALFLLTAIVALAIGGLKSFPGVAVGALLIGLLQQIIIRYGQAGIDLPFLEGPFRPSPTLVPAASIILMVVILLVMPSGLMGRKVG
ncbi:MAG TPA: hypothetical protein VE569_03870 [Acidimicrobiia bacterium]|jgi:branched-chain amino acid transport system permease protein|nr:hypothetical protein [Acidimicrobiia bacterium]